MGKIFTDITLKLKDWHDVTLELNKPAIDYLSSKSYNPEYGARELRRIERYDFEWEIQGI